MQTLVCRPDFNWCCAKRAHVRMAFAPPNPITCGAARDRSIVAGSGGLVPHPIGPWSIRSFHRHLRRSPHCQHHVLHRASCPVHHLPRIAVGILLIAALLLAIQAQSMFGATPWEERDAGIPYALAAMITFAVAALLADRWLGKAHDITDCLTAPHKINPPGKTDIAAEIRSGVRQHPWRTAGVIASFVLGLITLNNLRIDPPLPDYNLTLIMWLASIVLFAVSIIILSPRPRRDWKVWWAEHGGSSWPSVRSGWRRWRCA